ncbi:M48 family metallopeptidase [Chitinimonas lacunae]|uniref:M48 family metallopeptidase n=1 Tax=Chitinimonas lacunae TaxID=1963018 RepID=A0ABV8MUU2_9NEIS
MSAAGRAVLEGRTIDYQIRRSARRRSVGLRIDASGLTIRLPARFPLDHLEPILQRKASWIVSKLDLYHTKAPPPPSLADGGRIDWLGHSLPIRHEVGRLIVEPDAVVLPQGQDPAAALTRLMQREARRHFAARVAHWSARIGLTPQSLALSHAQKRWGSCTAQGVVRLNWRLMQAPPSVIDYVVIHELCHLEELNHSDRFWTLVESACPDWREQRAFLKREGDRYFAW